MRVLWIGYGQAGGKLADAIVGENREFYDGIAINTEEADCTAPLKLDTKWRFLTE